jgi:hypothetical protein
VLLLFEAGFGGSIIILFFILPCPAKWSFDFFEKVTAEI